MLIALAFTWAYKAGIYRDKNIKKIIIKKHGRLAKSVFKYGLEWLAQVLINAFASAIQKITSVFLSCTYIIFMQLRQSHQALHEKTVRNLLSA